LTSEGADRDTGSKEHTPEFKALISLEAIKGEEMIAELAKQRKLHSVQISQRTKNLLNSAASAFVSPRPAKENHQLEMLVDPASLND